MVWLRARPSDHEVKVYVEPLMVCGDGAITELLEPTTTVVLNGVARAAELTASFSLTAGRFVLKGRTTDLGVRRPPAFDVGPPAVFPGSRSWLQRCEP